MPVVDYGQKVSLTGVTRYEKVLTSSGGDGKWHYIDRQNLGQSCGPACARMVALMVTEKRIGEAYFAGLVSAAEQGGAAGAINPLSDKAQQGHDFAAAGTLSDYLVTALKDFKIAKARKADSNTPDWGVVWKACSEKAPAIISVKWTGGGAHFIVIAGPLSNSTGKILVLDPHYGVQQIAVNSPTTYEPRQDGGSSGKVLAAGTMQVNPGNWVEAVLTY